MSRKTRTLGVLLSIRDKDLPLSQKKRKRLFNEVLSYTITQKSFEKKTFGKMPISAPFGSRAEMVKVIVSIEILIANS